MDTGATWQARHEELRAQLRKLGALVADQTLPDAERDRIGDEFVAVWQEFSRHVKHMPATLVGA